MENWTMSTYDIDRYKRWSPHLWWPWISGCSHRVKLLHQWPAAWHGRARALPTWANTPCEGRPACSSFVVGERKEELARSEEREEARTEGGSSPAPCARQSSLKKEGRKTYTDMGVHLWQNKPKIALGYKLSGIDSLGPVLYLEGVNLTKTRVKGCRIDLSLKRNMPYWQTRHFGKFHSVCIGYNQISRSLSNS